jgi:hypothetical protein
MSARAIAAAGSPRVRRLAALALTPVVLLAGVELHPAGEVHDAFARPGGALVFLLVPEPSGRPIHLEPAHRRTLPVCPACVLQLQTGGAHLRPLAPLAPPAPRAGRRRPERVRAPRTTSAERTARGPPSS